MNCDCIKDIEGKIADFMKAKAGADVVPEGWLIEFDGEARIKKAGQTGVVPNPRSDNVAEHVLYQLVCDITAAGPLQSASDDDLWHVAVKVASMSGGSLFNVSQRDCVTAIRASFMNPDEGRAYEKSRENPHA